MKTSPTLRCIVTASALTLTAGVLQAQVVGFNASTAGGFTAVGVPPSDVSVHIDHSLVVATPFSFVSMVADEMVIFTTVPPSVIDGVFTFTGLGGETLTGTFTGELLGTPNPSVMVVTGPFDFTGGTGPFAGAYGGGVLEANIQFLDPGLAFGVSIINWQGELGLVPEPYQYGIVAGLGLVGFAACRRRTA